MLAESRFLRRKLVRHPVDAGVKIVQMTGKISPRACGRRSDANNAPKAACAGDRGFETGQKTGAILENSRLNGEKSYGASRARTCFSIWWGRVAHQGRQRFSLADVYRARFVEHVFKQRKTIQTQGRTG
jgi:hypothetical protein